MSTFSKAVFNTARYANFRPTYPKVLYDTLYKYHASSPSAQWKSALDLGCGTGQATVVLADRFESVIGVDPSAGMVSTAKEQIGSQNSHVNFVQSSAEDLRFLEDESVDFVSAAQAAHWFKYDRLWPELARVLRKGGTVALWNYSEFRISKHPRLTAEINAYASDPTQNLGLYWEQPGRGILDKHLQAIKYPSDPVWDQSAEKRVYFVGEQYPTAPAESGAKRDGKASNDPIRLYPGDEHREVILRKTLKWEDLDSYLRTWSPLVAYWDAHPSDKQNPEGDIVARMVRRLKEGVSEDLKVNVSEAPEKVEIEWPLVALLARKA